MRAAGHFLQCREISTPTVLTPMSEIVQAMTETAGCKPRKLHVMIRSWRMLRRLATDRAYRGVMWLWWRRPIGVFQPFNDTASDRYPKIFGFVRHELGAERELAILSFGCSTGEEVFSLRRYFPRATIKGIDVNPGNIAVARRRLRSRPDARLNFVIASSTAAELTAGYDAIFCMAVLRHGSLGRPGVARCDHLIRFEDFAARIADFCRCLKPGGLLAVRHSNFRLCDTPAAAAFETVLRMPASDATPLFGADNLPISGAGYPDVVFRKHQ
jgi:2-polyprenyl-3-methyl-5-hydroxy-6-metoxy-1,4-benzoquinol methylase